MANETKQLTFGNANAIDQTLSKVAQIEQKVGEFTDSSHDAVCVAIEALESKMDEVYDDYTSANELIG